MKSNNNMTIQYNIGKDGFGYHFKKQEMVAKKCIITGELHPINEVERLKEQLKTKKLLKPVDSGYILRRNIQVGPLMAYNLCSNKIEHSLDSLNAQVVINGKDGEDNLIKSYFETPHIISSASDFGKGLCKYELKLDKVEVINVEDSFFERAKDKSFSNVENFMVHVLVKAGIVQDYRRGDDTCHEADVITEDRQIELVTCLNKATNVIRYKMHDCSAAIIIDAIDTDHYQLPDGIIKKFSSKNYTNNYSKELAILFTGGICSEEALMKLLKQQLESGDIKNDFKKIYFILVDPIEDRISIVNGDKQKDISVESIPILMYQKYAVDWDLLIEDERYLLSCINIFSGDKYLMLETGEVIQNFIKECKVWQ